MTILTSKERSSFLNSYNRILIDFKSLLFDDEITIYKHGAEEVYYFFEKEFTNVIRKTGDFTFLENNFLKIGDMVKINHVDFKKLVGYKKRDFNEISYDTSEIRVEYQLKDLPDSQPEEFIIKLGNPELSLAYRKIINSRFTKETIEEDNLSSHYIKEDGILTTSDNKKYPYRITFSDDINHKMKVDETESKYFIKLLKENTFIRVLTITEYKEVFKIFTTVYVFNFFAKDNV